MNQINIIMERIKSYEDRIFFLPLSGKEIIELEAELRISFPNEFFDYLNNVGLLQDLIPNIFMTKNEYVFEKDFINRIVDEKPNIYFAFSNDGYGNLLVLKDKTHIDNYVYKISHDTGDITRTKYTFSDFIDKWVNRAIKGYNIRKRNIDKCWAVQFCFEVSDERLLCDIIKQYFANSLDDEWKYVDSTSAGVTSYSKEFSIGEKKLMLKKSEYTGWKAYHYSFDYSEPVTTLSNGQSFIENMSRLYNSLNLGFKLINYGILSS